MDYDFKKIEPKWQEYWAKEGTFAAVNDSELPKFYVLDMFPYPSGAGLHVGHPLGYIASDIVARYKRLQGFNVLHPMGYDSFGLPAEQYAIQTGQHPALTTEQNIQRYRQQLDRLGFSFDWDREVRTSDPKFYRWTQWIFLQLFDAWYNQSSDKAERIESLIQEFEQHGNTQVQAVCDADTPSFTAADWKGFAAERQQEILLHYRLAYRSESLVNWCPALGTVLANDEVKDGFSERGGHPVEQRNMWQWSLRITAYAQRLIDGLDTIDWSDAIKEVQRHWIGRSEGAEIVFDVAEHDRQIKVFSTRPDTLFGASFMVLAPEHNLVGEITTEAQQAEVDAYIEQTARKSERSRLAEKTISGAFTGAYAVHPITGKRLPVWISDYVLAGYGTGAIMAVPAGDERDWKFAKHFGLDIPAIFEGVDTNENVCERKDVVLNNSDFLNGLAPVEASSRMIAQLEDLGRGKGRIQYKLRDAIFGRQRYWGEPIPVYFKDGLPHPVKDEHLPIELPPVDRYKPTEDGEPPLARASRWNYDPKRGVVENGAGYPLELTTMPSWAGSSWYYVRYTDPKNETEFASKEAMDYWGNVDFYLGGAEHSTGHLLYVRFWTKALYDLGYLSFDEPAKKLTNQGMIQGRSNFVYRATMTKPENGPEVSDIFVSLHLKEAAEKHFTDPLACTEEERARYTFLKKQSDLLKEKHGLLNINLSSFQAVRADVNLVDNDLLDIERFKGWKPEFQHAEFICEQDGTYVCGHEVEKMSKSKFNVVNPDDICESHGADALRLHEMFLGPIEMHKPWNTQGIDGVSKFLRKLWRLYRNPAGDVSISEESASREELKVLHQCIQRVRDDLDRFSFNTCVSHFMVCVNALTDLKCNKREILEPLAILISCHAPHIAEELWSQLGHTVSISTATMPEHDPKYLQEDTFEYPVSFNGKMRFKYAAPVEWDPKQVEQAVLDSEQAQKYLAGKAPKKVIVVPKRIVNVVV